MLLTRVMLAGVLTGTAALAARPAAACVPPTCWPASSIPAGPATVPANVPALGFNLVQRGGGHVGDAAAFQLIDPDGKAVSLAFEQNMFNPGSYLVRPKEPLQPGRAYKMRYPQSCPGNEPKDPPEIVERTLMTGPVTPLPTSIGTVAVTGHQVTDAQVGYNTGACVLSNLRTGLTHVEIHPTPELQAYLALGRVNALIEGRAAPVVNYQQPGPTAPIEMDLYAHCAGDAGMSGGLMPGKYEVKFAADLLGVTPLPPPITATVELYCDDRPPGDAAAAADVRTGADTAVVADAAVPVDGGMPVADAGGATGDAGAAPADGGMAVGRSSGCGCVLAGGRVAGTPGGMLVLVALCLRRRRRRRSR
jgi:hypothetical protein